MRSQWNNKCGLLITENVNEIKREGGVEVKCKICDFKVEKWAKVTEN